MVIADLEAGGAQRVVTTLANAWAEGGRRVSLITLDDGIPSFFPIHEAVERHSLDVQSESRSLLAGLLANLLRVLALRRAIRSSGAPVVISFVGATNVLSILATRGLPVRLVISERNDPARQSLGRLWDWLRDRLYRYADLVTANSEGALATLARHVPAEKLAYLPNPVGLRPVEGEVRRASRTILSIGRLDRQKGYDVLLEAFARSQARRDGWRLAIVGEGPLAEPLRAQASDLGIAEQLEWRGRVTDTSGCYAESALFVLASRHEGMPNVVLEALSTGLPVIVSAASGGALELVEHEASGLVVPVEDPTALAAAIDRLAAQPDLRESLGDAGRRQLAPGGPEQALARWDAVLSLEGAPEGRRYAAG